MGFEQCHPGLNLIFFSVALYTTCTFDHPVFLAISLLCGFIYSIKRNRVKALALNIVLLLSAAGFALYYSSYNHFGITVLDQNLIGNNITLESLAYGAVLGVKVLSFVIWFSCVYSVFSSDKVVYLFGRIAPALSLCLSILLRLVPEICSQAKRINSARRGIGRGTGQGNIIRRISNLISLISMLITRTIEMLIQTSASMKSRGSGLKGRTAYSIYRFDSRDRAYVIAVFFCMSLMLMGMLLGQTEAVYDPMIRISKPTSMSYLFYIGYFAFCMMPLGLECATEYSFYRSRKSLKS